MTLVLLTIYFININMGNNYTKLIGTSGEYQYSTELNSDYAEDLTQIVLVGIFGSAGTDFQFASVANKTAQSIILTVLTANYKPKSITVECIEAVLVAGAVAFTVSVGSTAGGTDYIGTTACALLGAKIQSVAIPALDFSVPNNLLIVGKPTNDNWDTLTKGKWRYTLVYENFNF